MLIFVRVSFWPIICGFLYNYTVFFFSAMILLFCSCYFIASRVQWISLFFLFLFQTCIFSSRHGFDMLLAELHKMADSISSLAAIVHEFYRF